MGNEFGHPEWLDFPREGNGDSYHYARRQYNLVDDDLLRYKFLYAFDRAMQHLDQVHEALGSLPAWVSAKHNGDKVIAFERAGLLWVFNLHGTASFVDYRVGINASAGQMYGVALCSDDDQFGGHSRVDSSSTYWVQDMPHNGREASLLLYIPCRTALVLSLRK
jgi:1,4-alpha-glucan branching enzyme